MGTTFGDLLVWHYIRHAIVNGEYAFDTLTPLYMISWELRLSGIVFLVCCWYDEEWILFVWQVYNGETPLFWHWYYMYTFLVDQSADKRIVFTSTIKFLTRLLFLVILRGLAPFIWTICHQDWSGSKVKGCLPPPVSQSYSPWLMPLPSIFV